MVIFENRKKGNSRIVKIFGQVVYITTHGYKRRVQRYFGNLISTLKVEKDGVQTKTINFLNKTISHRIDTEDFKKEYWGNFCIKNIDKAKNIQHKFSKYINNYSDIFILNANSGEIYLFLTYVLEPFLKKNNCKKPLLVARKKYHIDLIKLLYPEIPHVYLKKFPVFKNLKKVIGNQTFYSMFTGNHFIQVENDIKNNPLDTAHYFYSIIDELGIKKEELGFRQVKISEELKNSTITKAKKIGLNLEKFVFIAPEAYSCEEYDNEFWVDLCEELQANRYDTFFNIVYDDTDIVGCSYKTCDLTFSEAFTLARMSKGVVSLRSGLTESLLQTNVPLFSLYTKFRDRYVFNDMDVEYVLSGFGLNKLPNVDTQKVFEFNMSEENNEKVINQIITKIQGKPDEVI